MLCVPPDALEAALLQHAQQLDLHRRGDVAHLVEEHRPAVRLLEAALALRAGAGETPLLVAKQLALQQGLGQGGAIDGDQRTRPLGGRSQVNGPGNHLLAGTRLALDQHRRVGQGDVVDQLEDVVHPRALAEHVGEAVLALEPLTKLGQLGLGGPLLQGTLHDEAQVLRVGRLGEEVVGPHLHRLHGLFDAAVAGRDDDGGGQPPLLNLFDELHPADVRHLEVRDDDAERALFERLQGLGAVGHRVDLDVQPRL
jgi:hypothetical protein